jgi:hypothetical protein
MLSTAGAISAQLFPTAPDFYALTLTAASWWLTDAVASMIVAPVIVPPVIVLWATLALREGARLDLPETAGIVIGAAIVGAIAVLPATVGALKPLLPYQSVCGFLILLPLLWASLRGNQRAAATAALIFCGLAAWGFADTGGAASGPNPILLLLAIALSISFAPLFLSTVVAVYNYRQSGFAPARVVPRPLTELDPETAKLIEDVTVDSKGRLIPKLYSKLQANKELRAMLNIGAKEREQTDVSRLSDAELIQQRIRHYICIRTRRIALL